MSWVCQGGKKLRDESGNVLILAALSMTALMGFMALGVDVGTMFHAKRKAQTAADAGAIAAAQAKHYGFDMTAAGRADAQANGFQNGADGISVQVNNPPSGGSFAGNASYVEVIVTAPEPSYFMKVLGINSMTVSARAVAASEVGNQCALSLAGSGVGLKIAGTSTKVYLPGCTISVNSSDSQSVFSAGGGTLEAAAINTVGGQHGVNMTSDTVTPPATGSAPVSDPLAGSISPPTYSAASCLNDPNPSGTQTIGPTDGGTICYKKLTINGSGTTVTFNPGVYVITGAFKLTGSANLSGLGVTFYLAPGASLSINGSGIMDLEAPTSGPYNGILFYQDPSNTSAATFNGGSNTTVEGIMYFPTADLTFGGGNASSIYSTIIAGTITFSGGTTVNDYAEINSNTPVWRLQLAE